MIPFKCMSTQCMIHSLIRHIIEKNDSLVKFKIFNRFNINTIIENYQIALYEVNASMMYTTIYCIKCFLIIDNS